MIIKNSLIVIVGMIQVDDYDLVNTNIEGSTAAGIWLSYTSSILYA